MSKKFWIAFPVTFILLSGFEFLLHGILLSGFYTARDKGFLPEDIMQQRMLWMFVGYFILAFLWTYFFLRFASDKNITKGIHHGVSYMIFYRVPQAFIWYSLITVSGYAHLWGIVGGVVEGVIIGAVMGAIMKGEGEEGS